MPKKIIVKAPKRRHIKVNVVGKASSVDDIKKKEEKEKVCPEQKMLERQLGLEKILADAREKEAEYLSQITIDAGREMTAAIIERYGDKSLSELIEESQRPKSMLIYKMMAGLGVSFTTMAHYLMCTPQSLRNKLSRDSFSLDDLIAAANVCGYDLILRKKDRSEEIVVDADDYFKNSDSEKSLKQWARLYLFKEEEYKRREKEMAQLQERMEKLKSELDYLNKEGRQLRNNWVHDS